MAKWVKRGNYWELLVPQKDPDWLDARKFRITGTSASGMGGENFFKTPEEQVKIISGVSQEVFDNEALERMKHGNDNEKPTRDWCSDYLKQKITEKGFCVPYFDLELGCSIDGDIEGTDGIIEIKCPVKMYKPILNYMEQIKNGWKPPTNYYSHIYKSHYFQMQLGMVILQKKYCIYVVNSISDGLTFTQKIAFNQDHWNHYYPIIKENYNKYVKPHLNGNYPILPS